MSSFSTYFGHHISTIEGGFVSTDDKELYEVLKSIRSHGWDRDASETYSNKLKNKWQISNFNALYTFYHSGFNLRSTDLQAFLGINQIDKLNSICEARNQNFKIYQQELRDITPHIDARGFISNFAYPIIHKYRDVIIQKLQKAEVEVRPMICGSMGTQPFYAKNYGRKSLPNASIIDKYGFYIPNHPGLKKQDILKITSIIKDVVENKLIDPYLQTQIIIKNYAINCKFSDSVHIYIRKPYKKYYYEKRFNINKRKNSK